MRRITMGLLFVLVTIVASINVFAILSSLSYKEFLEAEMESLVTIETYVQAKQSWWDDKTTVYTQTPDGAYFIYNMACSEEDYEKLEEGTKIRVTGYKSEWSGEIEIVDATFEFLEEGEIFVAEPEDVTDLLGTDDLEAHMNEKVAFSGLSVVPSEDAYGNEVPFLYNYDGSGTQGDDLYFNVDLNGKEYEFTVESYLTDQDSDVYKAVEGLKIGDVIDAEGFLYWYEGPDPHITSVVVVQSNGLEENENVKESDTVESTEQPAEKSADQSVESSSVGYITGDEIPFRSEPSTGTDDNIIYTLYEGDEVTIIGSEDGWYEIEYDGRTGWVNASYVKQGSYFDDTEESATATAEPDAPSGLNEEKNEFEYDFKTFRWGDPKEEVINVEGEPFLENKMDAVDADYIAYNTKVAGMDTILAYYFNSDGLYGVRYLIQEKHSNENLFIDDYEKLRSAITKKYGEPLIDYESWQDDSKKDYYSDRKGTALSFGYLTYYTYYFLDRTTIAMNMSADNYEIATTIDYNSNEMGPGEADYSDDF